jgi:hypothetical protein
MKTYIGTTTIHFNKNVKKTTKICASWCGFSIMKMLGQSFTCWWWVIGLKTGKLLKCSSVGYMKNWVPLFPGSVLWWGCQYLLLRTYLTLPCAFVIGASDYHFCYDRACHIVLLASTKSSCRLLTELISSNCNYSTHS